MMKLLIAVVACLALASYASAGENYAVLVAGSNGYYNYRHQSDICHAFQVLTKKGGIPEENIIVFMYDDIASDPSNPFPGTLINHPNGTDVYKGVTKDYTGAAVTPSNFLAVLAGNKTGIVGGSGRVLQAGPEDNVFVYFSDHGATGLIAFPSEYLYANDLINTLNYMHQKNAYKQLVFYIEACESGSMFADILPADISIYATTASTPDQSSYACYWDATRQAYLGDEYSVRWMEDADIHDKSGSKWNLEDQFKVVFSETVQSQPQQYGETSLDEEVVEEFEGNDNANRRRRHHHKKPIASTSVAVPEERPSLTYTPCGSADSRDIKLKTLLKMKEDRFTQDMDSGDLDELISEELNHRAVADLVADSILHTLTGSAVEKDRLKAMRAAPRNFECLKGSMRAIERSCGKFDDYSLKYVYQVVNLCEEGYEVDEIAAAATTVCELGRF